VSFVPEPFGLTHKRRWGRMVDEGELDYAKFLVLDNLCVTNIIYR
jgi:hypothetical protein